MDDDMAKLYVQNPDHYTTGLTRIGCTVQQAKNYSEIFNNLRLHYYKYIFSGIKEKSGSKSIIDFGCGTGDDLIFLDQYLRGVQFFGFELSMDTVQS